MLSYKSLGFTSKNKVIPIDASKRKERRIRLGMRFLGVILFMVSVSVLVQVVPLMYVFLGGIMGIPADASINDMNTMIWLLTSVTMMVLVVYLFIAWMKWVGRRFFVQPTSLFHRNKK